MITLITLIGFATISDPSADSESSSSSNIIDNGVLAIICVLLLVFVYGGHVFVKVKKRRQEERDRDARERWRAVEEERRNRYREQAHHRSDGCAMAPALTHSHTPYLPTYLPPVSCM